jgi:hypothetical protein
MLSRLMAETVGISISWLKQDEQSSGQDLQQESGVFGTLAVTVHNEATIPLATYLHIQPYQDMHNGTQRVSLVHKLAWVGSLQLYLPELPAGAQHVHHVPMCMLQPGVYYFQVNLTNLASGESFWAPTPLKVTANDKEIKDKLGCS